jgi:hypothetical protein
MPAKVERKNFGVRLSKQERARLKALADREFRTEGEMLRVLIHKVYRETFLSDAAPETDTQLLAEAERKKRGVGDYRTES